MKQKISYLTFIEDAGYTVSPKGIKFHLGKYRCVCGKEGIYGKSNVKRLHTRSCGCKAIEMQLESRPESHRLSNHPLYNIWGLIKNRCTNPDAEDYPRYGGRGVTMCDEWRNNFMPFYDWAINNGWRKGLQVDKDIKGGLTYSPENCSIVSSRENNLNRKNRRIIEFNGKSKNIIDWARQYGIRQNTLNNRLKHGWDFYQALTTPVMRIGFKRKDMERLLRGREIKYAFGFIN